MRRIYWICLIALATGCTTTEQKGEQTTPPAADSAAAAVSAAAPAAIDSMAGTWINTQFQQTLEKTKSIRQAVAFGAPNVSFYREGDQPVLFVNLEFREGITVPIDSLQRTNNGLRNQELDLQFSPDHTQFTLRLLNREHGEKPITFHRLNDQQFNSLEEEHVAMLEYINGVVLAGNYRDAEGKAYQFTPQLKAVLPDASFTYELALDNLFTNCDGISEVEADGERTFLGFAWKRDKLHLYRTEPDPENPDGVVCDKKPYAILTREERQ